MLHRREGVDYGDSGGQGEVEGCRGDGGVGLFACEGEPGVGAVGFLNVDRGDDAFGADRESETPDALFLTVGNAGEGKGAVGCGSRGEVVDFFLKLSVAEKKAQRRAKVVELLGGDALHLRVAGRVEPGELAVKEEDFAGRMGVVPAHAAGLEEQQGSALGAGAAEACVVLSKLGFEGVELVVVAIDALGDVVGGELLSFGWQEEEKGESEEQRLDESELSHPSRKGRGLDGAP